MMDVFKMIRIDNQTPITGYSNGISLSFSIHI